LPARRRARKMRLPMKLVRYLRAAAVFTPCYVVLDWVSYIEPLGPFNITPWNPQAALAVVWILLGGIEQAPAVFGTILLADWLIRGLPGGPGTTMLTAAVLAAGYTVLASALQLLLRPKPGLHTLRQLTLFVAVVVPGTAFIAAGFVGVLLVSHLLEVDAMLPGWLRFWVGDAVGILVTAPLLLAAADEDRRRSFVRLVRRGETYLQVALVAGALWLIFAGLGGDPSHHVYLLFLPLIWIAIRNGLPGAILGVGLVQLGVVLGIHHRSLQALPVLELQALVAALTLTALYLGVTVDERQRANDSLRLSLRLAAAGEMAGAIAHEVNQPLTALTNYGRSGQLLLEAGRPAELAGVMEKILAEAGRASEVVRRLRDFFRGGSMRFERVAVDALLDSARGAGVRTAAGSGIVFHTELEPDLPEIVVDRLQIEVVLRNLVVNAVEAISLGGPAGSISLRARRHDTGFVCIVVADSGPGVPASERERVFEPFVSGKPTGMGLGLSVSRAIAEAHGGALETRPGPGGEFRLLLPFERG